MKYLFKWIAFFAILGNFKETTAQVIKSSLKTIIIDAGHGGYDVGAQGYYNNEATITLQIAKKVEQLIKKELPTLKVVMTREDENLPGNLNNKNEANRLRAKIANESKGDLFIAIHVNSAPAKYRTEIEGYKTETYTTYIGKGKKRKKVTKTRQVPIVKKVRIPHSIKGTETYIWATNKNDLKKEFVKSEDEFGEHNDDGYKYFESAEAKIFASLKTKKYFDNSRLIAELVEEEFTQTGRKSFGVKQRDHEGIWVLQATAMPSILIETGFICTPEEEDYLSSEAGQTEVAKAIVKAIKRYKTTLEQADNNKTIQTK